MTVKNLPLWLGVLLALFLGAASASASELSEKDKINYLLNAVATSDATFIRNGSEYPGNEACDHLKMKLDYAGDRVKTAEDFVNGIASKSSMTGQPYFVRLKSGALIESAQWLHEKLTALLSHPQLTIKKQ